MIFTTERLSILPILVGALSFSYLPSVVVGWTSTTTRTTSQTSTTPSHHHPLCRAPEHAATKHYSFRAPSSRCRLSATIAGDELLEDITEPSGARIPSAEPPSLLSHTFEDLAELLGGTGKAKACWDCLRAGIDPIWYHGKGSDADNDDDDCEPTGSPLLKGWSRSRAREHLAETVTRGSPTRLGEKTLRQLRALGSGASGDIDHHQHQHHTIERDVCELSQISVSPDGTTKLLLRLVKDGLEVETVIIPWADRGKSTLCVSSQVGCKQGCTFCSTGRMGKLRNLSGAEILAQMYWANKICRLSSSSSSGSSSAESSGDGIDGNNNDNGESNAPLYPIDNCVFMGMGEPADNIPAVVRAATAMADPNLFQLAPRKITISTVAPHPGVFAKLAEAPVVLAWSVHSSRDELRRQLVPTTRHSMEELRDGLLETLGGRSKRLRNTMLEVTLLDGINDSPSDAEHLAGFCAPFAEKENGSIKLTVNLIPWNDISASFGPASAYKPPRPERVRAYQKVLAEHGILCYVRTTRGDEENAACGMLSTKKKKRSGSSSSSSSNNNNKPSAAVSAETND